MKQKIGSVALAWLFAGSVLTGCATHQAPSAEVQKTLAPSGELRVGVYQGSPTSIIGEPASGQARGVGFDLGRLMAGQLGVPFHPVVFAKNADLLEAAEAGKVDFVFTNATAARAKFLDFSPAVIYAEKGYLVPANSRLTRFDGVDQAGVRIGASQGSSTVKELEPLLKRASLVQVPSLQKAAEMLAAGQLDAFATNKAILFELADKVPGARVLDGYWGREQLAVGIPKGREKGNAFVRQFVVDMQAGEHITRAIARAGLRGAVVAERR